MKKFSKIIAVVLSIVMLTSMMTACSLFDKSPKTAADLFEKSKEVMAETGENYSMDMEMKMKISMSGDVEGAKMDMKLPVEMEAEFEVFDKYMHGEMKMDMSIDASVEMDGEVETMNDSDSTEAEIYIVTNDDETITYTKEDGSNWVISKEESKNAMTQMHNMFTEDEFASVFENATMSESKSGYVVSVDFADIMDSDSFDDFIDNADMDMSEDLGMSAENLAEVLKDASVKYHFNSEYYLTGIVIDEIEVDAAEMLNESIGDSLTGGMTMDEIKMVFSMQFKFDNFGEIEKEDVKVPGEVKDEAENIEDEVLTPDEPIDTPDEPIETPDNNPDEDPTVPVEKEPDEEQKPIVSDDTISDDWKDMDIKIDGVVYHFPYDYELLNNNGWYIDLSEYGYEDGYVLNKGDSVSGTIDMYHSKYGEEYSDFSMWVGFKNYGDKVLDILECDLWTMEIDTMSGFKKLDEYPEVEIAKGITWGATEQQIKEAFGEWNEEYISEEYGYKTVDYVYDYDLYMTLTIFEEHGLTAIEFKSYGD